MVVSGYVDIVFKCSLTSNMNLVCCMKPRFDLSTTDHAFPSTLEVTTSKQVHDESLKLRPGSQPTSFLGYLLGCSRDTLNTFD